MYSIKKISQFPPAFLESDLILANFKNISEIPNILQEIGFSDCKEKIVHGTKVYYKGKNNMIYINILALDP
jgi:hypothetical protein